MRTQDDILKLVLNFAEEDDRVRAAMMNGSRANPNILKDPLQDYDIVYFVTNVDEFRRNDRIPAYFGAIMILQLPEEMEDPSPQGGDLYIYLMQFKDGTRIDLGIVPVSKANDHLDDSLTVVLMDKDGALREIPPPSDADYLTHPPTRKQFEDCCNEFWWLNPYVAKAVWRDQLPLAKHVMECLLRAQLLKMLGWGATVAYGSPLALGKHGSNLSNFLCPEDWAALKDTYSDASYDSMWESLSKAGRLFRSTATAVAQELWLAYPKEEDALVTEFIRTIKRLPRDARQI